MKLWRYVQEQGTGNPGALLQQLQASQASPRQQALLMRMLQDSVLGAAAREPLAARVLPALTLPNRVCLHVAGVCLRVCVTSSQLALLETTAAVVSYITWLCMVMSPACSLHRAYQCACDLIVQRQICILCAAGRHFAAGLAGGGTRQGVRLRMLDSRSQGSYLSWSKHDMLCCVQESVSSLEPRRRHPAALQQEADAARMPELARWVVAPALCSPNSSRFGRLARCAETGGFCRASIPTLPLRCSQVMLCRLICQPWHCYLHKAQPHKRRSCGLLQALRVGL